MFPRVLPAKSRLLHIGPTKTGTSALQWAMRHQRRELSGHGLYYPKESAADRSKPLRSLARAIRKGGDDQPIPAWDGLVAALEKASGERVLVSHEDFAKMPTPVAKRVAEDLKATHVIAAARRYDLFLPSQWQQLVKTGATLLSYEEWLSKEIGPGGTDRNPQLWRSHDTVDLISRWSTLVPAENLFLIAIDESDRQLVPSVFESLLGLPTGILDLEAAPGNPSLTFHETEMLRSAFATLVEQGVSLDRGTRNRVRRALVDAQDAEFAKEALKKLPKRPPMPAWATTEIESLSNQRAEALPGLPMQLIGDVDNLRVKAADLLSSDEWAGWEDQRLVAHQAGAAIALTMLGERDDPSSALNSGRGDG